MSSETSETEAVKVLTAEQIQEYDWVIRPCTLYKEEFSDCTSIKARFHQYFIFGQSTDCRQWKKDYENCIKYDEKQDLKAASELLKSEEIRRQIRLKAHYGNNVWKKRTTTPPENWSSELPEWLEERNKNTYLDIKARELRGEEVDDPFAKRGFCKLM